MEYPIILEEDDNDTLLVTSPDFPELTTFGEDRDDAIARGVHALEEVIAARMYDREEIPLPSSGEVYATLPAGTSAEVLRYREMRAQPSG